MRIAVFGATGIVGRAIMGNTLFLGSVAVERHFRRRNQLQMQPQAVVLRQIFLACFTDKITRFAPHGQASPSSIFPQAPPVLSLFTAKGDR